MNPRVVRILGWAIVVAVVALLLVLPENRYDWMREMDPTIPPGAIVDGSGDGRVFAGVAALIGAASGAVLAVVSRGPGRWAAVAAALAVAAVWAVKFAG